MSIKWNVKKLKECESTFTEARNLPPWSIVSSVRQNKGRGRFNRAWFGEEGGLWANFNLPTEGSATRPWGLMPGESTTLKRIVLYRPCARQECLKI